MNGITIVSTDTEFRVYIPPEHKERAKKIKPRYWSAKDLCWIYPKNREIHEALLDEFGPEAFSNVRVPVTSQSAPGRSADGNNWGEPQRERTGESRGFSAIEELEAKIRDKDAKIMQLINSLKVKNEELTTERMTVSKIQGEAESKNEFLRERIKLLEKSVQDSSGLIELLKSKEAKLEELLSQNVDLKKQFDEANRNLNEANASVLLLQRDRLKGSAGSIERRNTADLLKVLADEGLGGRDHYFERDVMNIEYNQLFCIELSKKLCLILKKITGENGDLYSLIKTAEDLEILGDEAIDYAHTIRKQGNTIRHGSVDKRTYILRNAYSFLAAALLWPLMPEC